MNDQIHRCIANRTTGHQAKHLKKSLEAVAGSAEVCRAFEAGTTFIAAIVSFLLVSRGSYLAFLARKRIFIGISVEAAESFNGQPCM